MTAPFRLTVFTIAGTLLLLAGAPPSSEQEDKEKKFKCGPSGRYWVHIGKGEKAYCFDGTGFAAANAPPHIKKHFEPAASPTQGPVAARAKTVTPEGKTSFPGPSLPAGSIGGGGGGSRGGAFSIRGGGGSSGAGRGKSSIITVDDMMSQGPTTGGQGTASPVPARNNPLPPEAFRPVAVGMSRTQVQTALGPPHGRIMNSGDDGTYEIWTYLAREGGSASIRILEGFVVSVRLPE